MPQITTAPDRLLTVREAAERLNVSEVTVRRRISAGELAAVRFGTADVVRIDPHALVACLQPVNEDAVGSSRVSGEPRSLPAERPGPIAGQSSSGRTAGLTEGGKR
jgi:excisionase family DNA binding protein